MLNCLLFVSNLTADVHIGMDQEYSFPEQQWPNARTNIAADNDPEQQVTAPNSIPTIEDLLPAHQTRVTAEDCKTILSNASITTADRPIDKGKKHRKKVHAGVQKQGGHRGMSDKTIPLIQVTRHLIPTAQLLSKLSPMPTHPDPSGHHTQHQSSPSGMHVMHGTPRNVSTAEMDTQTLKKKKKKKKDKKVKKKDKDKDREKKKERMHNTVEKSDATGEESNGSIDVTTVEQSITEAAPPHGLNRTIFSPGLSQTSGSDELPAKHKMKKRKQLGRPTD